MRLMILREDPSAEAAALQYPEFILSVGEGRVKADDSSNIDISHFNQRGCKYQSSYRRCFRWNQDKAQRYRVSYVKGNTSNH